jgi:peptidoglycan/xylan/chitin deacetylase (PgdA/CDA1 family)
MVAFTFDDGPSAQTTAPVIDALEKYNVPATFFIVSQRLLGKYGEKGRELLAREIAGGFLVESHSFSHPNLRGANAKTLSREVDEAIRILAKEANKNIGLFRAPYGALDNTGRGWLKKRNLTEVFWSVDTLDWKARDAARLRKKVFDMIVRQDGGIVLMHDVKPITAKIVADVLDDLEAENCKRLAAKGDPIWPVSLHYFLRDKKQPRAIPDDVKKVTEAYKAALPGRCAKRPPAPPPPPPKDAKKSDPPKAAGK